MVIIRIDANLRMPQVENVAKHIRAQAATGVIILPDCCELLNEVPADEEIKVIHQDARVAELEAELAAAVEYITEKKDCCFCKHNPTAAKMCESEDLMCCDCSKRPDCICTKCRDGSEWEYRGSLV